MLKTLKTSKISKILIKFSFTHPKKVFQMNQMTKIIEKIKKWKVNLSQENIEEIKVKKEKKAKINKNNNKKIVILV